MINESSMLEEKEQIQSAVKRTKEQFKDTTDQWKQQATKSWEDLTDVVRRHPGKAMGVALLAGLGLGAVATASARSRSYGASDKLRDLAETGTDAWQRLRSGFSDAICSLKEAVDDAATKFK